MDVDVSDERFTAVIEVGSKRVTVPVSLDRSGQHTVRWNEPIKLPLMVNGKASVLPSGACNLYKYPKVFFDHLRKGKAIAPPLEQLFVLEELVRARPPPERLTQGAMLRLSRQWGP